MDKKKNTPTHTTIVPHELTSTYSNKNDKNIRHYNSGKSNWENYCFPKADCDKIEPYNVWLGAANAGMDHDFLEKNEISVIIDVGSSNAYYFKDSEHPFVEVSEKLGREFEYVRIDISDDPSEKISIHFKQMINFIDKSLQKNKNILIHCECGVSRSASIMIAYVMYKKQIDHRSAMVYVKRFRSCIKPNPGFIQQLSKIIL